MQGHSLPCFILICHNEFCHREISTRLLNSNVFLWCPQVDSAMNQFSNWGKAYTSSIRESGVKCRLLFIKRQLTMTCMKLLEKIVISCWPRQFLQYISTWWKIQESRKVVKLSSLSGVSQDQFMHAAPLCSEIQNCCSNRGIWSQINRGSSTIFCTAEERFPFKNLSLVWSGQCMHSNEAVEF